MSQRNNLDKEPRATINPYFTAAELVFLRLLWDLHPYSWISRKRIGTWSDRFSRQKAIILCNGPSLNSVDFGNIIKHKVFTFGLNKINLLFSRTKFRPSVIIAANKYVIEQNADFYNKTNLPLFLDSKGRKWVRLRRNVLFYYSAGNSRKFARDCSMSVHQGYSVTYVAMQFAFHMGFKDIALVGCDHSFATKGPANMTVIADKQDPNHFDPNYFTVGARWQLPDILGSELHYEAAKDIFERYGRKIVNCTEGGKLEIFERQSLSEFLNT